MEPNWSDLDADERRFLDQFSPSIEGYQARGAACPPPGVLRGAMAGVLPEDSPASQHVQQCPWCQALGRDLTEAEMTEPTAEEQGRIRARVWREVRPRKRGWWSGVWAPAPVAALAAIAMLAGVWIANKPRRRSGPEVAAVAPPAPAPSIPGPLPLEKPLAPAAEGLIWRGEPASEEAMLDAALAPYRSGDYPDAIRRLERFVGQHPRSAEGHFYLGVSLLFAGRNPEAAAALERAKALAGKTLAREAAWYLALSWQRQGQTGPVLAELRRLCDEPGEHQSAACGALREPPR